MQLKDLYNPHLPLSGLLSDVRVDDSNDHRIIRARLNKTNGIILRYTARFDYTRAQLFIKVEGQDYTEIFVEDWVEIGEVTDNDAMELWKGLVDQVKDKDEENLNEVLDHISTKIARINEQD